MPEARPRILVVDDTEAVRYATARILRRAGFEVDEAEDGASALRAVNRSKPDMVVLDVKLPDMSGFEVCHRIKSDPASTSLPILHVSAMCIDSGSKVAGLDAGADAYLTHPVSDDELLATINALLRIRRAEEEALKQAEEARAVRNELQKVLAALREKNHTLEAL
ncbi:MAG TPA: response regulator, partial [Terriglobales bacterium]|nr:response regulator [Terriglobales bacterium]